MSYEWLTQQHRPLAQQMAGPVMHAITQDDNTANDS